MADGRHAAPSAAAVLLLSGAAWAAHSTDLLRTHPGHAATPAVATGTAPVVRTDVRQQTTVTGTLTYAGSYSVIAPGGSASGGGGSGAAGSGMLTWLPTVGATVSRGEPVYELNGQPVPLLYGTRPAWRDLGLGISSGSDIRQLKRNLAALGYGSGLVLDGEFDLATQQAVENWQQAEGLPVTGTVLLGQVVFLPGPLLVSQQGAAVGGPVPNGTPIVAGTGTTPDVQVPLDPNAAPASTYRPATIWLSPCAAGLPAVACAAGLPAVACAAGLPAVGTGGLAAFAGVGVAGCWLADEVAEGRPLRDSGIGSTAQTTAPREDLPTAWPARPWSAAKPRRVPGGQADGAVLATIMPSGRIRASADLADRQPWSDPVADPPDATRPSAAASGEAPSSRRSRRPAVPAGALPAIAEAAALSRLASEPACPATVAAWPAWLELASIPGSRTPSTTPSTRMTAAAVTRT